MKTMKFFHFAKVIKIERGGMEDKKRRIQEEIARSRKGIEHKDASVRSTFRKGLLNV